MTSLNFISLANTLRTSGITKVEEGKVVTEKATSNFYEALHAAEIFILADVEEVNSLVFDNAKFEALSGKLPIHQPFKVVAVEPLRGVLNVRNPDDLSELEKVLKIKSLVSVEFMPCEYALFGSLDAAGEEKVVMIDNREAEPLLRFIFENLGEKDTGTELVNERLKLPAGEKKKIKKIKQVIHICPKRDKTKIYGERRVDWSHAWKVRGHWRKINSIGKDRQGNYVVKGFTWVSDHQKGDEKKGLVSKIRLIPPQK